MGIAKYRDSENSSETDEYNNALNDAVSINTVDDTNNTELMTESEYLPLTAPASTFQGDEINPETSLVVGISAALVTVLVAVLAYVAYQYIGQRRKNTEMMDTRKTNFVPCSSGLKVSYSLPDIQNELKKEEYWQGSKKVLRQTTLPTVPTRHQTFKRQLSHKLDFSEIQFLVCPIHQKESGSGSVGSIKPELYQPELTHQGSVESSGPSEMECGKLHFTLRYDYDVEGLFVKIIQAKDIPPKEFSGAADPYVKIYLLPDRKKKFQTKVHRRNLNPVFNETFVFGVPYNELNTRTLQFSIYDFDRFSRHDIIGHVFVRGLLDNCDLSGEVEYIMDILCARQEKLNLGELMLSLCYLPTAGRLTVTLIKARCLRAMDITGSSDPYVKVSLMCMGKRIKKKKTTVKKSTLNPVYNEALVFDVPSENIEDVNLLIKVIDYDRVGANELMGCCLIGSSCIGLGRDHWLEMLDNPRKPIAQWYPLLDTVPPEEDTTPTECNPRHLSVGCLSVR